MSIPGAANPLLLATAAAGGYQISRSLRFNSSDSAYLSRTPASAGNRKTWTVSLWAKRSALGGTRYLWEGGSPDGTTTRLALRFNSSDQLNVLNGGALRTTTQVFRDPSAWYHIVVAVDTPQATAANRLKIYVNGSQVTDFASSSDLSQNADTGWNMAAAHSIGRTHIDGGFFFNGYIAEFHNIDGQALTPSSFTEVSATTGQLIPKAYTGSFGTNGFWLKFSDNSAATATTLGKDYSGNSNNWTPNNLSVTAGAGNDSLTDTPSSYGTDTGAGGEVRGNYATLNPLSAGPNAVLANGNLDWSTTQTGSFLAQSTIAMPSGKWYCEYTATSGNNLIGIQRAAGTVSTFYVGGNADSWGYYGLNGNKYNNNSATAYGASYTTGAVIGIALDVDAGTLTFYKNGVSQGQAYSGLTNGPYTFVTGNGANVSGTFNFGQRPFAYTAPSGFKALCDTNLPAPVVAKPNTVMDVALYTGNGSTKTISGLGFSPDLVWIKRRDAAANHDVTDTVRGATKSLYTSLTQGEATDAGALTAFNSDGFSLGATGTVNTNNGTYAAWTWDAGTSTVTNTQGSITSQVRANPSAGFSIVTYTGNGANATVGHGCGVALGMVIVKRRSNLDSWRVYHSSVAASNSLTLNATSAAAASTTFWNSTAPTSTVFSVGTSAIVNGNGDTYVAYCFSPVAGYSDGFSYTGTGSTDGIFVHLGFRPRLILLKCSSTTGNWTLLDTARGGYNVDNDPLYPNLSNAEGTTDLLDITSNGFKLRTTDASVNFSGATYVGYAWAEAPFAYSRAR